MAVRQNLRQFRFCRIRFLPVIVEYRLGINTQAQVDAEMFASNPRSLHTVHIGEASALSAEPYHNYPPLNGSTGFHLQACIHQTIATPQPMHRYYWTYTVRTDEIH